VSRRQFGWLLVAVTLLGAALRAIHLDATAGFDETVNLRRFIQGGPAAILAPYSGYGSTNNHLVNSILTWPMAALFGVQMWALRLPAYLLGVLTVPLMGLAGRELLGERRAGAVAALFAALAPILISYSPACRGYSSLAFFTTLSIWLMARVLASGSRVEALWVFLSLLAAGWSHMSGLVLVGAAGAASALLIGASYVYPAILPGRRVDAYRAAAAAFAAGATLALWYSRKAHIVQDVTSKVVTGQFVDPSLAGLRSVRDPAGLFLWTRLMGESLYGADGKWIVPAGLASIAGVLFALRRDLGRGLVLSTLGVFPFVALRLGDLNPSPRYVLFVLPALLLLAASTAAGLGAWLGARAPRGSRAIWTWGLAGLFLSIPLPNLVSNLSGPGSNYMGVVWDIKGAARHVAAHAGPDDAVVHFPRPAERRFHWEWAFAPTWTFHEQHQVARLLSGPSAGAESLRIWYVSPFLPAQHFDYLPPGYRPSIEAELDACWVYADDYDVTGVEPLALQPLGSSRDGLGDWSWHHPVGKAYWELAPAPAALSITSGEEGSVADILSPTLPVRPGALVEGEVLVWAERGRTLRPLGRLDLTFFDDAGEQVISLGREALTWVERPPAPEGSLIRLRTVVPREARAVELSFGLADGNVDGTVVRFGQPRLSVIGIRRR
jgi:hypothetical protein